MSTQFKCAIFDLDGTLVNTIDDLGLATDYVLEQYGRTPKWTQADYKKLVGNGAKKLVELPGVWWSKSLAKTILMW